MKTFLLGCLCGFVISLLFIFIYLSIVVGGDKDE